MGDSELAERLKEAFGTCSALYRDTELPPGFREKYKVGLFLRESTFCDAAYEPSGFLAPHRFLLISSHARSLTALGIPFCLWQRGRIFKVIDTISDGSHTQITLLEIPEELVEVFCMAELSPLETSFFQQAPETFRGTRDMAPLAKLDTEEYKQRMRDPIGINDAGQYFPLMFGPLSSNNAKDPKTLGFRLSKVLNHQALVHLNTGGLVEAESSLAEAIRAEEAYDPSAPTVLATSHRYLGELYFDRLDLRGAQVAFQTEFSYTPIRGGSGRREHLAQRRYPAHRGRRRDLEWAGRARPRPARRRVGGPVRVRNRARGCACRRGRLRAAASLLPGRREDSRAQPMEGARSADAGADGRLLWPPDVGRAPRRSSEGGPTRAEEA